VIEVHGKGKDLPFLMRRISCETEEVSLKKAGGLSEVPIKSREDQRRSSYREVGVAVESSIKTAARKHGLEGKKASKKRGGVQKQNRGYSLLLEYLLLINNIIWLRSIHKYQKEEVSGERGGRSPQGEGGLILVKIAKRSILFIWWSWWTPHLGWGGVTHPSSTQDQGDYKGEK